jgi:ribulose-phosphate 3-epimerase
MAVVVPTVTASSSEDYANEIKNVEEFAPRIHIDLSDGEFSPVKMINPAEIWWPEGMVVDVHVMNRRPEEELNTLASKNPSLIVFHAESEGNLAEAMKKIKAFDIRAGVALLPETSIEHALKLIELAEHVLVFGGHLGYHGGEADLSLLSKVQALKSKYPDKEIGWDGGINSDNASELVEAGVDVLNTGGFIQNSTDPQAAYEEIMRVI